MSPRPIDLYMEKKQKFEAGRVKTSEANVQRAICDFLSAKKVLWFRMNAGDRLMQSKGKTYRIRGHEKGTADLLALLRVPRKDFPLVRAFDHNFPLFIEVKAPGKKQSPEQVEFEKRVKEYGVAYLLAESVDEVIGYVAALGL